MCSVGYNIFAFVVNVFVVNVICVVFVIMGVFNGFRFGVCLVFFNVIFIKFNVVLNLLIFVMVFGNVICKYNVAANVFVFVCCVYSVCLIFGLILLFLIYLL